MLKEKIKRHKILVALSLIVILAVALRFWSITSLGLWPPDAGNYVRMSTWLLGTGGVPMDWTPPLFSISIAVAFILFGAFDFVAVAVPALFGVLSVILVYFLGKEIFNKKIGLIAALFLAVTEYHIIYSRLVAVDSMLTLFYLLSFLFFVRAFKNKSLKYYILFGLSASLALVTKYVGFHILVIFLIFIISYHAYSFVNKRFSRKDLFFDIKGILIVLILVIILQVGWIFVMGIGSYMSPEHSIHFSMSDINFQWVSANWPAILSMGIDEYIYVFNHSVSCAFTTATDPLTYFNALLFWVSPLILLFFILGCWKLLTKRSRMGIFLLIWLFFIFIFFNLIMTHRAVRFFVPVLPVLCLVAARGLDLIKSKKILVIILAAVILSGIYGSINSIQAYHNGYRQTGAFINENIKENDLIFYAGMPQLLFYHEIDTGNWWELGDMDSIDNITYVILAGTYLADVFKRDEFEREFEPVAVYTNEVAERELFDMSREIPDYYKIKIFRVNESIRRYFNY